ncbi:MAG: hypothetical protein JWQ34_2044 [Mucilaginibacter sp.]|uniref:hypothetical protein n=1 Tax=Mucilaginibacter sp. TaxID=1882438 RepID=UPI002609740C|nr:hypothetical protein [Mucilaginibacter sp.]MDB5003819.1 hypothetical protein [Mucilaginibacter sp.]
MKTETIAIHAGNHTDKTTGQLYNPLSYQLRLSVWKMVVSAKVIFIAGQQTLTVHR